MKKGFVWFIFILFSLLLLYSCGSLRKKAEQEKGKKTGNIAGIVFDVTTMQPLSGTVVYIEEVQTIGTKSDSLGRFWLSNVRLGEYKILAQKITFHTTKISNVKVFNDSTSIVVFRLCIAAIEPWGCSGEWDGKIIKTDSASFFRTQYKDLVKNK